MNIINGRNILELTGKLISEFPDRQAGKPTGKYCAQKIAECFQAAAKNSLTTLETFTCHPQVFFSWCRFSAIAYFFSAVLLICHCPIISLLLISVAAMYILIVFGVYNHCFDFLFPAQTGYNVVTQILPTDKAQKQIIITAHHDAAPVFCLLELNPRLYPKLMFAAVAVFLLLILNALISCFLFLPNWIYWLQMCGVIFMLPVAFLTGAAVSPGAGDNLVSAALLIELARELSKKPLKHTKIILASFDAEECGLRGSAAFLKQHSLTDLPANAIIIDTIYRQENLTVLTRDLNSLIPLSKSLADDLIRLYPMKSGGMPPGGGATDAANFAKAGIPAVMLTAMETDPAKWSATFPYHTSRDTPEIIDESAVNTLFQLLVTYLRRESVVSD